MIRLHRLSSQGEAFYLNPDLIVSVESTPDTVITLTTHTKVLVRDSVEEVVTAVREWRSCVLAAALPRRARREGNLNLTLVKGTAGSAPAQEDPR